MKALAPPSEQLTTLGLYLSPESPIRTTEFLKGRAAELDAVEQELRYFRAIPFIYGDRGVGKTSLARTVAQIVTPADREHVYVACAPGEPMLDILRAIALDLLGFAVKLGSHADRQKLEVTVSLNPSIKVSLEKRTPQLSAFDSIMAAVRTLHEIDGLVPEARQTVVVIDELESISDEGRRDLAFFIKQLGDQDFQVRFVLVGIADNVHELIGVHPSVPRYLKEVGLAPLSPQVLMDIVKQAADEIGVEVDQEVLYRIAIIGNGYPHFAHLMGKTILTEAVMQRAPAVTPDIYSKGVARAVKDSIQELKVSYEAATQRRDDIYKHLIWALANSDTVDLRIDDWVREYMEVSPRHRWQQYSEDQLKTAITKLSQENFGRIVTNTPIRYGSGTARYRYKRFSSTLMRGHVRLQAEGEGVSLGRIGGL